MRHKTPTVASKMRNGDVERVSLVGNQAVGREGGYTEGVGKAFSVVATVMCRQLASDRRKVPGEVICQNCLNLSDRAKASNVSRGAPIH